MKPFYYVGIALLLIVLLVVIGGYLLPVKHTATVSRVLPAPPSLVFAIIRDFRKYPSWRRGLRGPDSVAVVDDRTWRETNRGGSVTFSFVEEEKNARLVARIMDRNLPFGGQWVYRITAEGTVSRLSITEEGEVYNVVFRFLSRFWFGHTKTIEEYLSDMEKRVGAPG